MSIQVIESAEWKRYNANTRDSNVGDCVKRALTIAYSMDYDEVSKELNRIKRKYNKSAYNLTSVYYKFVEARGSSFKKLLKDNPVTVEEMCDMYPEGTYLLEVGEKPGKWTTHLCVIVDGILFDSWDSRKWYVDRWATVSTTSTPVFEFKLKDMYEEIKAGILPQLQKLSDKWTKIYPCSLEIPRAIFYDRYTCEITVTLHFSELPPEDSGYSRSKSWGHLITLKGNPRLDEEENIRSLIKKTYQKIYDWSYNVLRAIKDAIGASQIQVDKDVKRRWLSSEEKRILMHLPEWCRGRITELNYNENSYLWDGPKYEAYLAALPDDPYIDSRGDSVRFEADTLKELKDQINYYKEDFSRFNYEY